VRLRIAREGFMFAEEFMLAVRYHPKF